MVIRKSKISQSVFFLLEGKSKSQSYNYLKQLCLTYLNKCQYHGWFNVGAWVLEKMTLRKSIKQKFFYYKRKKTLSVI